MIKYYQDNTSKKLKVCEFIDGEMQLIASTLDHEKADATITKGCAVVAGTGIRFNAVGYVPIFTNPGMFSIDRWFYQNGELMLVIGNHNAGKLTFSVGDEIATVSFVKAEPAVAVNTVKDLEGG
jgi:hypothetical protein